MAGLRVAMKNRRRRSQIQSLVIGVVVLTLFTAAAVNADNRSLGRVLPPSGFSADWSLKGPARLLDKETLFEHINGEAELFFPYGFDLLATATYVNRSNPDVWLVADVYRMATPLDAFGIYANYRRATDGSLKIGVDGFLSATQMMFCQDRYFIRLQVTGATGLKADTFLACGRIISERLPRQPRPGELEVLDIPVLVPRSERYISQSLLGYAFFRRGLIADAVSEGRRAQVFVVLEASPDAARAAFERYLAHLKTEGRDLQTTEGPQGAALTAEDPLYGTVWAELSGRYLFGVVRAQDPSAAKIMLGQLRARIRSILQ